MDFTKRIIFLNALYFEYREQPVKRHLHGWMRAWLIAGVYPYGRLQLAKNRIKQGLVQYIPIL